MGAAEFFPFAVEKKDIYEMKCLSVSLILSFSFLVVRLLIESVLKGFHCAYPQTLLWIADAFIVSTTLMEDAVIPLLSLVSVTIALAS